ncbi:hypothetical protein GCM10010172_30510 [Paractinoplanes ferrugineus]|uniref:N-acetyltransferase domain-containing protein n=1 Tax=Paractinoplanes ferrugineus TaxID=113564 RepID=A0A919J6J6_9ACTN|nr:GNAT family N-acetyltransferase [Actinoplanes ferrugineus]GIE14257.1 hypothetical protein Afe05nite_60970 [Actinoplanes ferrugineus]
MEWLPTALTGERVVVRTPAAGDEPALVEMATDAQVRRYIGGPVDPATAQARAAQKISDSQWGQFVIVDRAAGVVAGSGSMARKRGPWEISYQLRPQWWRQGLTSEAVSLILGWFFTHTDEDLVIATTQHANTGSRCLLERLGAAHVGSFEQYGLAQERYEFYRPSPQTPST